LLEELETIKKGNLRKLENWTNWTPKEEIFPTVSRRFKGVSRRFKAFKACRISFQRVSEGFKAFQGVSSLVYTGF
jgi:hypothetical protein